MALKSKPIRKQRSLSKDLFFIFTICAALGIIAFLIAGDNGFLALQKKEAELRQIELEQAGRVEMNRRLAKRIDDMKAGPQIIEKHAREELKLVREGEVVLNTNPQERSSSLDTPTSTLPPRP